MERFQAKGVHDHLRPEAKSTAEARRSIGNGRKIRGLAMILSRENTLSTKVRDKLKITAIFFPNFGKI